MREEGGVDQPRANHVIRFRELHQPSQTASAYPPTSGSPDRPTTKQLVCCARLAYAQTTEPCRPSGHSMARL